MQKQMKRFYLSQLIGRRIRDSEGEKVGTVKDIAILWDGNIPKITGIRYSKDLDKLISADKVAVWDKNGITLSQTGGVLNPTNIRPKELYVGKWLLDKQIIDLKGSKLVRVNDILLSCTGSDAFIVAADIGLRGLLRRVGLEFLSKRLENHYILWQSITPTDSRTGSLQLDVDKEELNKLHPADIADFVEEMDYNSQAAFVRSLDAEQAADALAEMEIDTQVGIISQLTGEHASDLLEELPPDEAADILSEMPEEKSAELLQLMEDEEADEVKKLMQYEGDTAGGLMTTEYIDMPVSLTVEQAIERLRELAPEAETIYYLYIVDEADKLLGVLSLRELIISGPNNTLGNLMHTKLITVHYEDGHRKIAERMQKYSLLALPVVDEHGMMLGIITVDDVLDILMPERSTEDAWAIYLNKHAGRNGGSK